MQKLGRELPRSVRLRAGELDYFGPLLGFYRDALSVLAGGQRKHFAAKLGKACFDRRVGEGALISRLSVSMISAGVFFGAPIPAHALVSKPGTKSPSVGTSGSPCQRAVAVTAKGRSLPAVCSENLDSDVLVMQPANQGIRHNASDPLNWARDRRILGQ